MKTLAQIAAEKPYPDYAVWWPMGASFIRFMSQAILAEWRSLGGATLQEVHRYTASYIRTVFARDASGALTKNFAERPDSAPFQSGEFDALSYAFFRSAFEQIQNLGSAYDLPVAGARRRFTQRVGRRFFTDLHDHLGLALPVGLDSEGAWDQLSREIDRVGAFLVEEGYLRDHFKFTFEVHLQHAGNRIDQDSADFLDNLDAGRTGYALYEMGYPAILPSAVYLYHTMGEAQHHSSRTIEELFARMGFEARETDDFDPTGFPSDKVVELWEIVPQKRKNEN